MVEPQDREVERNPGQQLLDELHALNIGVDRLGASVEDLTDIIAAATGIELTDDDDVEESEDRDGGVGGTLGVLGNAISDFLNNMGKARKGSDDRA